MKKQLYLLLLLSGFLACRQNTSSKNADTAQGNPNLIAITNTVHGFYEWYDTFIRDTGQNINFLDMRGKYAKLDAAKVDQYFNNLKAGGFISDEFIAGEKDFLRKCEPLWQTEDKNAPLTGLDYNRFFCAQDWNIDFWTKAPVNVNGTGADRVAATLSGTEAGTPREQHLELKLENDKWLITRIICPGSDIEDYSGAYNSNDSKCGMDLTITLKEGSYLYRIKTGKKKQSGKMEITQTDGGTYLTFKGLLGARPKTEIQGLYSDNKITIQNYGNSMNEYLRFKECDLKYIELTKYANSVVPSPEDTGGKTAGREGDSAGATKQKPASNAKNTGSRSTQPVVTVNRKGEITLSGKKTTFETLKKDLQAALLNQAVIPDRLSIKSVGEVGMGTRQEVQTLVNEAVAGAKWLRKKSAIDALNASVSKKLAMPTQLQINSYRTSGSFALIDARPLQANGQPVNYELTVYRDEYRTRKFADRTIGLLKYEKGAWKVLIYTIGLDQVAAATWRKKYGAPRTLFGK